MNLQRKILFIQNDFRKELSARQEDWCSDMYNHLSRMIPDNRYTRRYLADFPRMAEEFRKTMPISIPYSLFRLFQKTGSRIEYEAEYFKVRKRCDVFAAMVLSGHSEYMDDLQDTIAAICEEYTWALPAHIKAEHTVEEEITRIDLFASETAFMLSEIWYLLKEEMDEEINQRICYELQRRIVAPYLKNPSKWGKNNWSSVCAHGVLTTFVYLGLDEELKTALPELQDSLQEFLDGYQDDGYSTEGALYWSYGFESFVYAASLLREYTHGEIDYFKLEKVHAMAGYGFYTYFDDNKTLPFADSPHRLNYNIGLYHFLKNEYPELPLPDEKRAAMFGDESRCRFFEMMRNLYWFDETMPQGEKTPDSYDFPISQVYIRNSEKYHFACKGGHNGENHNHNDVGSFMIIVGDEFVLDDPGWQEYDMWYFTDKRYTDYITAMSQGHSLPIIDNLPQKPGREREAKVISAEDRKVVLDLSEAYALPGISVIRSFELAEDQIIVCDCVKGAQMVTERFVTRVEPQIMEDGSVCIGSCRLKANAGSSPTVTTTQFVPRLVSNIGMKPLETLYMIDFLPDQADQFMLTIQIIG